MHKLLLSACVAALVSGAANAQQHFTFTDQLSEYSYSGPGLITGSFDGTLSGNLITNLSNISVSFDGIAFNGSGSLYSSHYDFNNGWESGGAVASLDGTQNNFLFINSDYPNDTSYSNFFLSISAFGEDEAYNINSGYQVAYNLSGQDAFRAQLAGGVPEPASWAMMLGGFGLVGAALRSSRRKAVVSFA